MAWKAATCPAGSGSPASVSTSSEIALSVRPAIDCTGSGSSRPNSSANAIW